jgi:hypothetical protein
VRVPFTQSFILEHIAGARIRQQLQESRHQRYPLTPHGIRLDKQPHLVTTATEARAAFTTSRVPIVWRRGARETDIMRWNTKYLEETAGEIEVKILALGGLSKTSDAHCGEVMSLSKYLEVMKDGNVYLRFSDLLDHAPNLRKDVPLKMLRSLSGAPTRTNLQFFLGPKGSQTPLHAEMNCNVFVQVFGKKRWVLFPASATKLLQPPAARQFYFFSALDALGHIPSKSADALTGWEIILEPGDILLCPPLLWHSVENLTTSCSFGLKFNRYWLAFKTSPLLFAMNALARNPSYPTYLWETLVKKRHPILATK